MKKRSRNYARRQLTWMRKIPNLELVDRTGPRTTPRLRPQFSIGSAGVKFEKWQALGNDYLILERERLPWELTATRVEWLCDQHFGVGADGVLLLSKSDDPEFVADLRIFNPDGSEAELSGNGAREAILYLRRNGWTDAEEFAISTVAGPIRPTITGELTCSVDMGHASTASKDFPSGPEDGRGTLESGGPFLGVPARLDRQPAMRDRRRHRRARRARPRRDRARDRRPRALPEPNQRLLSRRRGRVGCGRGSSSAAWGRRSPRAPAPAVPR